MPGLSSQTHSSLSGYAPPSEPLAFSEEEGLGAEDIFSMCSIMCFIPWRSFLVIPGASSDGSVDDVAEPVQEFQEIKTTEDEKQEHATASQSNMECASYQPVPSWKQKYISRKSMREHEALSQGDGLCDSESSKRTTLEETLDRCRQIDTISDAVSDVTDEEDERSSMSWSMASFFGMSSAESSSSASVSSISSYSASSLYSALVGRADEKVKTSSGNRSCSGESSTSSVEHSYDSILPSPVSHKGKYHRRQLSPSGVMDYVE